MSARATPAEGPLARRRLLDHPAMGRSPCEAWLFRLVGRPAVLRRPRRPREHTRAVLTEALALSAAEIRRLREEGVLARRPSR